MRAQARFLGRGAVAPVRRSDGGAHGSQRLRTGRTNPSTGPVISAVRPESDRSGFTPAVRLAEYGLTSPQYAVLALLAEHPGISNAELARRSFVAAPTMLRILDALSQTGLITRAALSPEQRARRTILTS